MYLTTISYLVDFIGSAGSVHAINLFLLINLYLKFREIDTFQSLNFGISN